MEDLSQFCCQNQRCIAYGIRRAGNLSVCGHIGKHIRLLHCCLCHAVLVQLHQLAQIAPPSAIWASW